MQLKPISFYLPQFHPISENDEWWGPGFTEWTNVSAARPRFEGHHQPHIPADLGFYDLRLAETRIAQAELASRYGIGGFCYYHYWFNGKLLLERPLRALLASDDPAFPFCLCWANENWTRAWDGLDRQVLMAQDYSEQDAQAHIDWFIEVFKDERYIKIDGRPLLVIYRPDHIPDPESMIGMWREALRSAGFPDLYLCAVKNGFVTLEDHELLAQGYDAIVDFQPNRKDFPAPTSPRQYLYRLLRRFLPDSLYQRLKVTVSANNIVDYKKMAEGLMRQRPWPSDYRKFPCVFPSWDNTARRNTPTIIQNNDPAVYGAWLKDSLHKVSGYPEGERLVFINAWNEWAEGCHLEPDRKLGHAFLEETLRVVSAAGEQI